MTGMVLQLLLQTAKVMSNYEFDLLETSLIVNGSFVTCVPQFSWKLTTHSYLFSYTSSNMSHHISHGPQDDILTIHMFCDVLG